MKHAAPLSPSLMVSVGEVSPDAAKHSSEGLSFGILSEPKSGTAVPAPMVDPFHLAREFPARWQRYIQTNFRNTDQVAQCFGVSERAARKWWDGEGGPKGAPVAMALVLHPESATQILLARAA